MRTPQCENSGIIIKWSFTFPVSLLTEYAEDRDINEDVVYLCKQGLWFKSALEHLAAVVNSIEN